MPCHQCTAPSTGRVQCWGSKGIHALPSAFRHRTTRHPQVQVHQLQGNIYPFLLQSALHCIGVQTRRASRRPMPSNKLALQYFGLCHEAGYLTSHALPAHAGCLAHSEPSQGCPCFCAAAGSATCTAQHCTALHSTAQHSTAQHSRHCS